MFSRAKIPSSIVAYPLELTWITSEIFQQATCKKTFMSY